MIRLFFKDIKHHLFDTLFLFLVGTFMFFTLCSSVCGSYETIRDRIKFSDPVWKHTYTYQYWNYGNPEEGTTEEYFARFSERFKTVNGVKACYETYSYNYCVNIDGESLSFFFVNHDNDLLRSIRYPLSSGRLAEKNEKNVIVVSEQFKGKLKLNETYEFYNDYGKVQLKVIGFYEDTSIIDFSSFVNDNDISIILGTDFSNCVLYNFDPGTTNTGGMMNDTLLISADSDVSDDLKRIVFEERGEMDLLASLKDMLDGEIEGSRISGKAAVYILLLILLVSYSLITAGTFIGLTRRINDLKTFYYLGMTLRKARVMFALERVLIFLCSIISGSVIYRRTCVTLNESVNGGAYTSNYWDIKYVLITSIIVIVLLSLAYLPYYIFTHKIELREYDD
jgi:hypothetical protein